MKNKTPQSSPVVVRFPPSPTGLMHVGTARTMLFNYLFAKQQGGKIIMRIEDTDRERSKKEYEDDIIQGLEWLGLSYDEFYRQTERGDIYKKHLEKLVAAGTAYESKEEPKEPGQRDSVIRLKNPNKVVTFDDVVRGTISVDTTELGDFIIAKSVDEPLYHFAVVVDDFEMGITHVIRGEDHISNTPRQILIQEALGAPRPVYAHLPLMLGTDRSKLSKRKHGEAVSVSFYRKQGFLPEAFVNFLALVGWNPGTDQEIFSMQQLLEIFSLENIQKGGAIFNLEKLRWVNRQYLQQVPDEAFKNYLKTEMPVLSDTAIEKLVPLMRERISVFADVKELLQSGELSFIYTEPKLDGSKIAWKESDIPTTTKHLQAVKTTLKAIPDDYWTKDEIHAALWPYAETHGKGVVLWPLRYTLTGQDKSPDPFTVATLLGKQTTLERIDQALRLLA
jgi:glutamyl-tRNA synthetase